MKSSTWLIYRILIGCCLAATSIFAVTEKPENSKGKTSAISPTADLTVIQDLQVQLETLKTEYNKRIQELESKVRQLQLEMLKTMPESETPSQTPVAAAPPAVQSIPGALNPAIAAVGNFVARGDSTKVFTADGDRIDNKLNLREAEIDLRVPIDPYADGVLIASFSSEAPGKMDVGIEEGYVNIKKLPFMNQSPLGLKLKLGRFHPEFGSINILHTHDLPQTFRPLVVQEFLGEDGFVGNGISGNFFLPTPWDKASSLDMTLQVLSGGGIAISPDSRSRTAYLGHLRWFKTFNSAHNVQLGWSTYHHPSGNGVRSATMNGVDFMYRWKPARLGEWNSFLLGSEVMFSNAAHPEAVEPADVARATENMKPGSGHSLGYTVYGQWQFNRRIYSGVRWDQTDSLFNPAMKRSGVTPYFSYYFSEFLRFRLNFEHRWSDFMTEKRRNSLYAEINWVFGAHPSEPFWVNK